MATQMDSKSSNEKPQKKRISLRTALLIIATVILTVFAVKNLGPADVWPIGRSPLIVVIAITFVLGALIGWLSRSILTPKTLRGGPSERN